MRRSMLPPSRFGARCSAAAELVGVDKELALSPKAFATFLRQSEISILFLTTALFNHIAAEEPTAFNTLNCVMFGGEAVDPRWVRRVLEYGGPGRLLNGYGPTESTTFATWHPIREVASRRDRDPNRSAALQHASLRAGPPLPAACPSAYLASCASAVTGWQWPT